MKILLSLSASPSEGADGQYGVLSLAKSDAKLLLSLHAKAMDFVKANAGPDALSEFLAPSFGWRGASFEAYRWSNEFERLLGGQELESFVSSYEFEPASVDDDAAVRVECHRVEFSDSGVKFSALSKYGSETYSTPTLPFDLLRKLAA